MQKGYFFHFMRFSGLLLSVVLLGSSCSKLIYQKIQNDIDLKAVAYLTGEADGEFIGLKSIVSDASSKTTEVLLIHGVRSQDGQHFQGLINTLAGQLGFTESEPRALLMPHPYTPDSLVIRHHFSNAQQEHLYFYNVFWSPITDQIKDTIYQNLDQIANRTALSQGVKQKFLIDVFADLALYLGHSKRTIQQPVEVALDTMMQHKDSKKVLITGSFGSKIVFDVLLRRMKTSRIAEQLFVDAKNSIKASRDTLLQEEKNSIEDFLTACIDKYEDGRDSLERENIDVDFLLATIESFKDNLHKIKGKGGVEILNTNIDNNSRVQQENIKEIENYLSDIQGFYMLSNQLPFTSLMELAPETSPDHFIANIYQDLDLLLANGAKEETASKLKIISFYDPNDLFGYRLPVPEEHQNLEVVNVEAHNTTPFYFNPDSLRSKYLSGTEKSGSAQKLIRNSLRQGVASQSLIIDIDEPSESAKSSPAIINHLIYGHEIPAGVNIKDTVILTVNAKPPKPRKIKYKRITIKNAQTGKRKILVPYEKPQWLREFIGEIILQSFTKRINKLDVKKSYLANELPPDSIDFNGLQSTLETCDTLHILTMHGMVSKSPEHFDLMIEKIRQKLNFNEIPLRQTWRSVPLDSSIHMANPAQIKIVDFENNEKKILRFYVVYWSPITQPPKTMLKDLDAQYNMKEKRSVLPAGVKELLINDGFCDVTLSLRTYRPLIDRCLKEAFLALGSKDPYAKNLLADDTSKEQNIFFISGSLGSKLLFDYISSTLIQEAFLEETEVPALRHISPQERVYSSMLIKRVHTFFMLSNQLPLISIRDLQQISFETSDQMYSMDWTDHIYNEWERKIQEDLHIVSFYDPNDILGFQLKEKKGDQYTLQVTNVPINLAGGYDINVKQLIRLTKKIDRVLSKAIPSNQDLDRKADRQLRKTLLKKLNLSITANLLEYLDIREPKQTFVLDFLSAHEGGKKDDRVIEMISFGTERIKKRKY